MANTVYTASARDCVAIIVGHGFSHSRFKEVKKKHRSGELGKCGDLRYFVTREATTHNGA